MPPRALPLPKAQEAALGAVASVLVHHLEADHANGPADAAAPNATPPLLIQVDGPGATHFVGEVVERLRTSPSQPWRVVRFDAWQYQRVAPPWWWLITAIDSQLQAQTAKRRQRVRRR